MYRILIIEDEAAIAQMYQFKLKQKGYDVVCSFDGRDGFATAKRFLPQLILLDLRMPGQSGDKVLEKIRRQDWGGDMRVIVLTNISRDEAPSSLRLLGVDRYIVKAHYTPAQVVEVVEEVLRG